MYSYSYKGHLVHLLVEFVIYILSLFARMLRKGVEWAWLEELPK